MVNVRRDPEEVETRYLHRLARPTGARVIEIGCGEGRLMWRYAAVTACVSGVDTSAIRLADARRARPESLANQVHLILATAEALPFADQTFDLAILAWSL
jgi:ubiquinone/menaquinone biosynthesis C-methylase UbiE